MGRLIKENGEVCLAVENKFWFLLINFYI
jgi:hypothetical protein